MERRHGELSHESGRMDRWQNASLYTTVYIEDHVHVAERISHKDVVNKVLF